MVIGSELNSHFWQTFTTNIGRGNVAAAPELWFLHKIAIVAWEEGRKGNMKSQVLGHFAKYLLCHNDKKLLKNETHFLNSEPKSNSMF